MIGDPMYDAFLYYGNRGGSVFRDVLDFDGNPVSVPERFYYMTCHRQENTGDPEILNEILSAMESLDAPTVYPVHPRNQSTVRQLIGEGRYRNILFIQPVGYLSSIAFAKGAEKIVTDSGGVQREAFFAGKQCVTVLDFEVWPETMKNGCNRLAKPHRTDILEKLSEPCRFDPAYQPFGDGHSSEVLVKMIGELFA